MHQLHFTSQANAFLGVFLDRLLKTVSRDEVRIVMVLVFKKKKYRIYRSVHVLEYWIYF